MGSVRVRDVDPARDPRWDAYVRAHPGGLVYHHSAWLGALQAEYPRPAINLALEDDDGTLRGVLALVHTRGVPLRRSSPTAGARLSSLPRTPLGGPLAGDDAGLALLVGEALRRMPADAHDLQLKPATPLDACVPPLVPVPWRDRYVLDLPERPEDLRFRAARNIAAARRAGVVVRRATSAEDVRAWHRLYLETMRDHLLPARPRRLFDELWTAMAPCGMMRLLLAERDGRLLAGTLLLMLGSTVHYAFNGSRRDAWDLRPNDLLQAAAIHDACAEGYGHYDLGEVEDGNTGLAQFKRKWAGPPDRLTRYAARPVAPSRRSGGPSTTRDLAARVWRHVPLRATAAAGSLTFRYL